MPEFVAMKLMSNKFCSSIVSFLIAGGTLFAVPVNDGSDTAGLVRLSNANGVGFSDMTLTPTDRGGNDVLTAAQIGERLDFPLRTVWYSDRITPMGSAYMVEAAFQPAAASFDRVGGVMGWLNLESRTGVAFLVTPSGDFGSFEVATVDFQATDDSTNQSVAHLFNLDGSEATSSVADQSAKRPLESYDAEKMGCTTELLRRRSGIKGEHVISGGGLVVSVGPERIEAAA